MLNCDAETGVCSLPETSDSTASHVPASTVVPFNGAFMSMERTPSNPRFTRHYVLRRV